jgi:hypothetical protein
MIKLNSQNQSVWPQVVAALGRVKEGERIPEGSFYLRRIESFASEQFRNCGRKRPSVGPIGFIEACDLRPKVSVKVYIDRDISCEALDPG